MALVVGNNTNCYNKGEVENNGCGFVSTNENCGVAAGIVGVNSLGNILNCYNKGIVKALPSAEDQRGVSIGGIVGTNSGNIMNVYNRGNIITNGNSSVCIGGIVSWDIKYDYNRYINYVYNTGDLTGNSVFRGGIVGALSSNTTVYSNFFWLESTGATNANGGLTIEDPTKYTSEQIKNLITNGELPSTDWATDSNINNGYPHLKTFDDTTVWLRDSNINDGDPYLKENLPQ